METESTSIVIGFLIFIYAIITILVPFFVLKIRIDITAIKDKMTILTSLDKKMTILIRLMAGDKHIQISSKGELIKICASCGAENDQGYHFCAHCKKPI